jgi:hypothetical protein
MFAAAAALRRRGGGAATRYISDMYPATTSRRMSNGSTESARQLLGWAALWPRGSLASKLSEPAQDSAHATKALELFLPHASAEAFTAIDTFMRERHAVSPVPTLDEFLLDELHRPIDCPDRTVFGDEWKVFATSAQGRDRSRVAERAWKQWRGFPTAKELQPLEPGGDAADVVERLGVVRLPQVLSPETVVALRAHVLAERTEGERRSAAEPELRAQLFSRVLSPKGAGRDQPTTRWDVRLPWDSVVQAAVAEALEGELGDAFCALTESDSREYRQTDRQTNSIRPVSTTGDPPRLPTQHCSIHYRTHTPMTKT